MNKQRWIWVALLAGAVTVAGILIFRNGDPGEEIRLEKIQRGDIALVITATGKINPVTRVQVGTQVTGTISKIHADFNTKVKRGEVIAQIDPTFLKAQLLEAEASAERARAQVDQARKTLNRATELFERKLISQAEKDEALTNYNLAIANEKQAAAANHRAEVALQYTTIVSPIDGVVISRNVDVGQTVAASLQAPVLFEIANDLSKIQVEAIIDEVDIGKVKVGQEATFFVDAYPDEKFYGKVSQIRLQPIVSQNLVGYEVIIDASNEESKLLPGMTANLSIVVETRKDVLRVANSALRYQPALTQEQFGRFSAQFGERFDLKSNSMVWKPGNGSGVLPVIVETGITDGAFTEIRTGDVQEGMMVVAGVSSGPATANTTKRFKSKN